MIKPNRDRFISYFPQIAALESQKPTENHSRMQYHSAPSTAAQTASIDHYGSWRPPFSAENNDCSTHSCGKTRAAINVVINQGVPLEEVAMFSL